MADKKKTEIPSADNVDQIREIIFGGVMRDYDSRFKGLSSELSDAAISLRKDFEARLDALTKQLQRDTEKAAGKLKDEVKARQQAIKAVSGDLDDGTGELNQTLGQLQQRLDDEADVLRHDIDELRTQLLDRINDEVSALRQRFNEATEDLDQRKVSRDELAGLLSEMAMRLKGDLKLPDTE